jgi:hypothetical protein
LHVCDGSKRLLTSLRDSMFRPFRELSRPIHACRFFRGFLPLPVCVFLFVELHR